MSNRKSLGIAAALVAILVGVGASGYAWYSGQDAKLSIRPPSGGQEWVPQQRESTLGVRVAVPFSLINRALNTTLPREFSSSGNGEDVCREAWGDWPWGGRYVLWRHCVGTRYEFTARRPGNIVIGPAGKLLHAEIPVTIEGNGGFRGDLGRITGVSRKNFRAAAIISADLGINLTADWCPAITARASYRWTQTPRVEIVSRVWVDVSSMVSGKVDDAVRGLPGKLAEALPCSSVRDAVAPYWKAYDVPIAVPGTQPLHVHIQPVGARTSGLVVTADGVRLAAELRATVQVAGEPMAPVDIGPLPPLEAVADAPGALDISLPLRLPYDRLEEAVSLAIVGKDIEFDLAGRGTVTIKAVEVYPGEDGLAVGLAFSAKLPGRFFDVSGTAYAVGSPIIDETGTSISIADFSYARTLDSELWSVLSAVFEGPVRSAVEAAVLDLNPLVESAVLELREAISDPSKTGGALLSVGEVSAAVREIVADKSELIIVVEVKSTLDAVVTEIEL